jgi:sugar phosphate permease
MFIIGFAYSWGPAVWVVCSEIFPLCARGKATGLTTMTNWLFTTIIVGAVFPIASDASLSGCFAFFACVIFTGTWIVYFFEAETAKRNILEIDEDFANNKPVETQDYVVG